MGLGDDIMATALADAALKGARERGERGKMKIAFGEHDHVKGSIRAYWSEVFRHSPVIVDPNEGWGSAVALIQEYPGKRVSIDPKRSVTDAEGNVIRFAFNEDFHAPRGTVLFSTPEIIAWSAWHGPSDVIIEPSIKGAYAPNKAWPFDRWERIAASLIDAGHRVTQFIYDGTKRLGTPGIDYSSTRSFREACFALSQASLFIGTDGGLHHAAAAFNVPAIVLWSHYSSPDIFGYDYQHNVRRTDGPGCGNVVERCDECQAAMEAIKADHVSTMALEVLATPT